MLKYLHICIDLASKIFPTPFTLLITALVGWLFCYSLSSLIESIPGISNFLSFTGKNTMEILALHFLSFKIVALIKILISNRPFYLLASFPALESNGVWCFLYILTGVCFPLLFAIFLKRIIVNNNK